MNARASGRSVSFALVIAVGAALTGALGETAVRLFTRAVLHRPTYLNPQAVWLAPLFGLAVLAIPAVVVSLALPRARRVAGLTFLGVGFALAEIFLLVPRVAPWALLLLACGVAAEVARRADAHPAAARWIAARWALLLAGAAVCLGVGVNLRRLLVERRALATPERQVAPPPNVVFVVLDAVRAEGMRLFGGPVPNTPFLETLAARCVTFDRAIAPASWTLPSHASMFTGRWASDLDADWLVPLDGREPVLAERLAARGFATGAAVGNYLYTYYEFGLDRGFAHFDDYGISASESALRNVVGDRVVRAWNATRHDYVVPGRKPASRIRRDALRWVDAVGSRSFLLFLNWYDAHDPYAPPAPWRSAFAASEPPTRALGDVEARMDSASIAGLRTAYHGSIAYLDAELDSLVSGLRARGLLDRTVLVVTSDHGEEFGEHGRLQHGYTLYYPSVHVPLLICPPGLVPPAARRVSDAVSLRDVGSTILDLVDRRPGQPPLPGHSLAFYWNDGAATRCRSKALSFIRRTPGVTTWYRDAESTLTSLVAGDYQLVRTDKGSEELYDVSRDPFEQRDLSDDPAYDSVMTRMRESLAHPDACAAP